MNEVDISDEDFDNFYNSFMSCAGGVRASVRAGLLNMIRAREIRQSDIRKRILSDPYAPVFTIKALYEGK